MGGYFLDEEPFDEQYRVQGVNFTGLGFGYLNVNNPRTIGGTLTVRF